MVRPSITGMSRLRSSAGVALGCIKAGIESTANRLNIFEPITLPIAKSCAFLRTAAIDAANSGKLVPIAIMVKPIIGKIDR